jgi:dihydrofolate reductase
MARVIVGTTMSLDGYINDQNGSVARLYPDMDALHNTEMLQNSMRQTGAVVMGRHAFDMAAGDFTDYEYQVPIFVLTHYPPRETVKGQNENLKIIFVGDGIHNAISQAKLAAGEKDVTIVGGANTAQQVLNAGLGDELQIGIVPILLGGGLRFFDNETFGKLMLEQRAVLESSSRTDIRFRILK